MNENLDNFDKKNEKNDKNNFLEKFNFTEKNNKEKDRIRDLKDLRREEHYSFSRRSTPESPFNSSFPILSAVPLQKLILNTTIPSLVPVDGNGKIINSTLNSTVNSNFNSNLNSNFNNTMNSNFNTTLQSTSYSPPRSTSPPLLSSRAIGPLSPHSINR